MATFKPSAVLVVASGLMLVVLVLYLVSFYTELLKNQNTEKKGTETKEDSSHFCCEEENELTIISMFLEDTDCDEECNISALADSCAQITKAGLPSGLYWIRTSTNAEKQFYCDTTRRCCNKTGGWTRVAYLRMSNPNHSCPGGWREITSPRRTCGRGSNATTTTSRDGGERERESVTASCSSAIFPTQGLNYSHVCGRIIGYQYCNTLAFWAYYHNMDDITIDDPYVDGVTITHGLPRNHVWTFATALHEDYDGRDTVCPCTNSIYRDAPRMVRIPPWVNRDYFCETGANSEPPNSTSMCLTHRKETFYTSDPLWDGKGCGDSSTCCEYYNPPWFCKRLDKPTTDDIEVRICGSGHTQFGDTPIELVEIYVQ